MKEHTCGECRFFRDGICKNRTMRKECFPSDNQEILYVSEDERQCALFQPRKTKKTN